MNRLQISAAWFALLPMAAGLSVLGLFVLTDALPLATLGVMLLWLGLVMNVATAVLVIAGHVRARRDGVAAAQRWLATASLSALVVANWPIAAVCAGSGIAWSTRYTLELDNRGATPWQVELRGPGVERRLTVPREAATKQYLWFRGDGSLTLQSDGGVVELDGYVTHNLAGRATAVREPDGAVRVIARSD